jgi:hypothetical protein
VGRCLAIFGLALWCSCHLLFPFENRASGVNPADDAAASDKSAVTPDQLPALERPHNDLAGPQDAAPPPDKDNPPLDGGPKDVAPPKDAVSPKDKVPCCPDPQCCSGCTFLPKGSPCSATAGYPGECDGAGQCFECIPQGSQCGSTDPTPCCGGLDCANWRGGAYDTCGP